MAKIIATTFGAVLVLFGLAGFAAPSFLGGICSPAHNLLNLVCGGLVVGLAQKTGAAGLFWGTASVALVYLGLGVVGILLGQPGTPGVSQLPPNDLLWVIVPRALEFGKNDHLLHLLFGLGLGTSAVVSVVESPFRLRK